MNYAALLVQSKANKNFIQPSQRLCGSICPHNTPLNGYAAYLHNLPA